MEVVEEMAKKARMLFLRPDHKFHMDFCKNTRSYLLRNPKNNQCHPLELFLIVDITPSAALTNCKVAFLKIISRG